jgi:hypothetical protein
MKSWHPFTVVEDCVRGDLTVCTFLYLSNYLMLLLVTAIRQPVHFSAAYYCFHLDLIVVKNTCFCQILPYPWNVARLFVFKSLPKIACETPVYCFRFIIHVWSMFLSEVMSEWTLVHVSTRCHFDFSCPLLPEHSLQGPLRFKKIITVIYDQRFSRRWRIMLCSSVSWHRLVCQMGISVSEEHTSVLKVEVVSSSNQAVTYRSPQRVLDSENWVSNYEYLCNTFKLSFSLSIN